MQATPGPWIPYESGDPDDPTGAYELGVMNGEAQVICRVAPQESNATANAHLLACAPELLAAAEQAYLRIAEALNDLPVEAGHLAHGLEEAVNIIEATLFKAKRAEGR